MKIFNTQAGKKQEFVPIKKGMVGIYCCGPTVYNYFHIGNARPFIVFDCLNRYLKFLGYKTTFVQNITDIDDKIIQRAEKKQVDFKVITKEYIQAFFDDKNRLGIGSADYYPRATEYVPQMVDFICKLIKNDNAYEVDGDVYFSTKSLNNYGSLSGKKIEEQLAGARVEITKKKRDKSDFVLWKKAKKGEPSWQSPWSLGRPGWHTECVVMSRDILGEALDIHAGGCDLLFPHHENELAQASATSKTPFVRYWMHNGFLNIEGEKMSKSLDNFFTARDILNSTSADAIRYFFLSKHYRSPIDFSKKILTECSIAIKNLTEALVSVDFSPKQTHKKQESNESKDFRSQFIASMDDDLNTAKAISTLFAISKRVKDVSLSKGKRLEFAQLLYELGSVLGFFQDFGTEEDGKETQLAKALIELLIAYRQRAKLAKNWAEADRIRDDLGRLGVELADTKQGTVFSLR